MIRQSIWIAVLVLANHASADAQTTPPYPYGPAPPPAPTPPPPAPAPTPPPTTTAPATPTASTSATVEPTGRTGVVLLTGVVVTAEDMHWRGDVFMPIPTPKAPRLHVGFELGYQHDKVDESQLGLEIEAYTFLIAPTAYYEWKLVTTGAGNLMILAEGGIGLAVARIKADVPYMPGKFENARGFSLRLASALQFRSNSGVRISVQPFGINIPLSDIEGPPQYDFSADPTFEFAMLAGYQFQ